MALINTVSPENAEGIIKEGYDMFIQNVGMIPKPMEMMSASPALFEQGIQRIHYFSKHPNLSFGLLAHIRYLAARALNYEFCTDLNKFVLGKLGVTEPDFEKMEKDPTQSLLEENEGAMLAFVVKSIKDPKSVTADEIEHLKELGWTDRDMVDALAQGVSMIDHSIMMQVFQFDQKCMIA
ncbi:MAG: hypothetical protein GY729_09825 [Desulfobacteraceae bacterium]|nr:hypothetical protein [Desulfobacteraceae bacterium]